MATRPEVQASIDALVLQLAELDPELRRRYAVERTVSCRVYDLDVVYAGRLTEDGLCDLAVDPPDRAQVRLSVSSDDLLALCDGSLAVRTAFATGRLRIQAGPLDLLRLRTLL